MKFEWDEDKNQLNVEKHGIDFETAMLVFNGLQRIEIYDMEHSINEEFPDFLRIPGMTGNGIVTNAAACCSIFFRFLPCTHLPDS